MNEHKAVPNIRFNSFEDKWKDTKLKKLAPLRGGHAFSSIKFRRKGIPIIRITNILENGKTGGNFVYYSEAENDVSYTLRKGDCILAMSGATIGKSAVVKEEYNKYYQNQRVGMFQQNSQYYYRFVIILVKSNLFSRQLSRVFVQGAQPNISSKEIDSFNFYVPNKYTEQQKIGDFFTKLDKLIDLQQQKIDKLELLKKALLQKLFPKHDAQIPELRFKGFEDVWESMKFKNILNYERPDKYIVKSDNYSNNGIPVLTANKSFILGYTIESSFYEKPLPIIIFDDFTLDCKLVKFPFKIKSSAIKILSSNNFSDIWFDFYLLKATSFIKEGHARHYISIVQNKKINVPCEQEQQKIGNLLSKVDQLIELENKKLQNLQQVKKCLLQNMFVE